MSELPEPVTLEWIAERQIEELLADLKAMRAEMRLAFVAIDDRLRHLDERLDRFDARLDALERR